MNFYVLRSVDTNADLQPLAVAKLLKAVIEIGVL